MLVVPKTFLQIDLRLASVWDRMPTMSIRLRCEIYEIQRDYLKIVRTSKR